MTDFEYDDTGALVITHYAPDTVTAERGTYILDGVAVWTEDPRQVTGCFSCLRAVNSSDGDGQELTGEATDYIRQAVATINTAHDLAQRPATKRALANARAILEQLVCEPEPEFPVYVGWDGQEHGEY